MCWMCGCADHIGLGNDREIPDDSEKELNDIIDKIDHGKNIKNKMV